MVRLPDFSKAMEYENHFYMYDISFGGSEW